MANKLDLLVEAEKRGILPADKKPLLDEARRRGLVGQSTHPQEGFLPRITRQALEFAKTEGAPTVGGMVGGTLGAAGGPLGAVGGAALGGAAGRAFQTLGQYATGSRSPLQDTATKNAAQIAASGVAQGGAEAGGLALGAAASALKPAAVKTGAQILKMVPKIPEKYGQAVLSRPKILLEALSKKDMRAAYEAFEKYTGLKGLGTQMEERGKLMTPSELSEMVLGTAKKVKDGVKVTDQDLYSASQAVNHLKLMAKYGEPSAASALETGVLQKGKSTVEGELEKRLPEYAPLRKSNFESKARQAFSSPFPLNKNQTPDTLRAWTAAGLAGAEAARGDYKPAAALPLLSPAAVGLGIRGATLAAPVVGLGASVMGRTLLERKAQEMALEALRRQQGQP